VLKFYLAKQKILKKPITILEMIGMGSMHRGVDELLFPFL